MRKKTTPHPAKFAIVWVTTPNRAVSKRLSRLLVEGRLAACVNILPGLTSRYWWKGKVETDSEELLVAKTLVSKLPEIEAAVQKAHPYEVCEVIAMPLLRGNGPYLRWITENVDTRPKKRRGE